MTPNAKNNYWYHHRKPDSPTLVFVHGILSCSETCWRSEVEGGSAYWPDLVVSDPRLKELAIFMGGYSAGLGTGRAEISDCADQLFQGLSISDIDGNQGPGHHSDLVFVCHSTGGIVVRYMLEEKTEFFKNKRILLVLIASPSGGSKWASFFHGLAKLYGNRLAQQLAWDNWSLRNLDRRFKNLVNDRRLPGLMGVEAYEEHFIIYHRYLPNLSWVVSPESAAKYFGSGRILPGTNHWTAVKPNDQDHPAHKLLVQFWEKFTASGIGPDTPKLRSDDRVAIDRKARNTRFVPVSRGSGSTDERSDTRLALKSRSQRMASHETGTRNRVCALAGNSLRGRPTARR